MKHPLHSRCSLFLGALNYVGTGAERDYQVCFATSPSPVHLRRRNVRLVDW